MNKDELKERMLFLLDQSGQKAFNGLDWAVSATRDKFGLESKKINRIWKEFDKIGVNPITLPNRCEIEQIPNIRRMIELYNGRSERINWKAVEFAESLNTEYKGIDMQFFIELDEKLGELSKN